LAPSTPDVPLEIISSTASATEDLPARETAQGSLDDVCSDASEGCDAPTASAQAEKAEKEGFFIRFTVPHPTIALSDAPAAAQRLHPRLDRYSFFRASTGFYRPV
jgi:hypothetical protein